MIQTISDKLKQKFQALTGTGKPFTQIYDYHTLECTSYPYLCFEPTEFSAEIGDTCNNRRTFTFTALIFQDLTTSGGREEARNILVKAIDDVIYSLDTDYTLGETVTQVIPVGGRIEPFVVGSGKCLVGSIQIQVEIMAFLH